jgi:hypothetical protein
MDDGRRSTIPPLVYRNALVGLFWKHSRSSSCSTLGEGFWFIGIFWNPSLGESVDGGEEEEDCTPVTVGKEAYTIPQEVRQGQPGDARPTPASEGSRKATPIRRARRESQPENSPYNDTDSIDWWNPLVEDDTEDCE